MADCIITNRLSGPGDKPSSTEATKKADRLSMGIADRTLAARTTRARGGGLSLEAESRHACLALALQSRLRTGRRRTRIGESTTNDRSSTDEHGSRKRSNRKSRS